MNNPSPTKSKAATDDASPAYNRAQEQKPI